jgi:type I restriction enzyme S subunit
MPELPEHWTTTQLDLLITRIEAGLNVKCEERPPEGNEKGLVKISAVTWGRFDEDQSKTLPDNTTPKETTRIAPGDLLFSRANTIDLVGASVIVGAVSRQLYLSDKVLRLVVETEETKKWINYAVKTAESRKKIEGASSGNQLSMRNIGQEKLKAIEIPLAPLAEQKQIAAKLDELLAQVDTLKARLDAIPAIIKKFRQSVLAAAVSGRLTEGWRKERPQDSWRETTFEQVCTEITVGFVGKMADKYQPSGIPFLRSQNVRPFRYAPENLLYISEDFHKEIFKSRLNPGDLAVVRSGAPGTTCVIPDSLAIANCSDLVIARPSASLNSKFACIYMNSEVAQLNVANNQVGVAQQHFNVGSMKKMPIHLPPIDEQTEIVHRVEQLFAFADQIEQRVQDAQARVNHLTQSILAKAFRGELTAEWRAQNPDLISGENSAEALLARIRAGRAGAAPRKKRGRTS